VDPAWDRKIRLYGCACLRTAVPVLRFKADQWVLEVAERFADGEADERELAEAARACGGLASAVARVPATRMVALAAGGPAPIPHHPAGPMRALPDAEKCALLRDIFGNPFRPVALDPSWLTSTAVALATGIYAERAFDRMPILADALQDAGCYHPDVLSHCRGGGPHARGCWVVDLILGKS
jgi:hypothetical protein